MNTLTIVFILILVSSVISQSSQDKALWISVKTSKLAEIKKALNAGANPDWKNGAQETVLHYAAAKNNSAVVNMLLDAGADIDTRESSGKTPLYLAAWLGYKDIVKILLNEGADPDIPRDDGNTSGITPLIEASYRGKLAIVKELVNAESNVRHSADDGSTALHWVARGALALDNKKIQQKIARILLRKGAEAMKKDNNGYTPVDIARGFQDDSLANTIESYNGPYDSTVYASAKSDLFVLVSGVVVFIAESLYSMFIPNNT